MLTPSAEVKIQNHCWRDFCWGPRSGLFAGIELLFDAVLGPSQSLVVRQLVLAEFDQFGVVSDFKVHEKIIGLGRCANQLVEFRLQHNLVAILGVLNDAQHDQGDGPATVEKPASQYIGKPSTARRTLKMHKSRTTIAAAPTER
jgi:hypothetical protein